MKFLFRNQNDILICGHTHIPMFVQAGKYSIINHGSTSLPKGGSVRSDDVIYLDSEQITYEFIEIKR